MKLKDLLEVIPKDTDIAIFDEKGEYVLCTTIGNYSDLVLDEFSHDEVLSIDTMMVTMFRDEPTALLCVKTKDSCGCE